MAGAPASRSSGGTNGSPSAAKTPSSSGASGSGSCAATHSGEPVARTSSVPRRDGSATTSSTGTPSTVTPSVRPSPRSTTATICGKASKRSSTERSPGTTTASRSEASRQRRGSPAAIPPSASAIDSTSGRLRLSKSGFGADGCISRARAARSLRSVSGPIARHLLQAPGLGRLPQLSERAHAEHPADLQHPLDRDAEEAPEPGELGRHLALELLQLCDLARLDELLQPPLDPRADPAQFADAALPNELRDRRRRRADQVGRAPVGPRRVRPGTRQLEQRGELVEPRGDLGIVRR